ncbi:MAG: UDP-3-O-[3-hydroxymyristoyl] N-acetylglucosamine deacetylase [Chthonomonadales bacterium]|nr:UDP-3-O-[3-hydroxymyristoyl] N-acetylglucosamine deacetylase [Chthonomonadales bacterium]
MISDYVAEPEPGISYACSDGMQTTVRTPVRCSGVGLHSGNSVHISLYPADPDTGIVFRRKDMETRLAPGALCATQRCTSLRMGESRLDTVEHLLAALHAAEVDNVIIEVDGDEVPILDGSARPWMELLDDSGIIVHDVLRTVVKLHGPVAVVDGASCVVAAPADRLRIRCVTHFDHPLLGTQTGDFVITPATFRDQLAPARTFGFEDEIEALSAQGLARGATLDNALLISRNGYSRSLRYHDECLRHKVVDLIGDLFVLGRPLRAEVIAVRPGHRINGLLTRRLSAGAGSEIPIDRVSQRLEGVRT